MIVYSIVLAGVDRDFPNDPVLVIEGCPGDGADAYEIGRLSGMLEQAAIEHTIAPSSTRLRLPLRFESRNADVTPASELEKRNAEKYATVDEVDDNLDDEVVIIRRSKTRGSTSHLYWKKNRWILLDDKVRDNAQVYTRSEAIGMLKRASNSISNSAQLTSRTLGRWYAPAEIVRSQDL